MDGMISQLEKLSTGIVIQNLFVGSPMFADDLTLMSRLKRGLDNILVQVHNYSLKWGFTFNEEKMVVLTFGEKRDNISAITNRRWLIGGKEIMEKSFWNNLGKDWHTNVSSLIPILEAAKKGQAIGIGLANLGCRFNGMSPLVATKLWATLNREKQSKLQRYRIHF
jgi:hypothetical protein